MTRIILAITSCIFMTNIAQSQGIYRSAADFEEGKLSYVNEADTKSGIRSDMLFDQSSVKVKTAEGNIKLRKDDLYGYRDKNNQDFRFFGSKKYRVVNKGPVTLYAREENIVRGKAKTRETIYYFSTNAVSDPIVLNKLNLKRAYPTKRDFHDMLDIAFRSDRELLQYDSFYNEYRLQSVMRKTL